MIVDASIVFKWLSPEEGSEAAFALLASTDLIAPSLLLSEVGNALWKKVQRKEIEARVSFADELANIPALVNIREDTPFVPRALTLAYTLRHPIYDCVYLALAEAEGTIVKTADQRFIAAVRSTSWQTMVEPLS